MKKLICLLLALSLVFALAGCGKEKTTYQDAGYYEIFSSTSGGDTMYRADYDRQNWLIWLRLDEGGAGVLHMDEDEEHEVRWHDGIIRVNGETVSYALVGGMLTLDLGKNGEEFILIFKQADPSAAQAEPAQPSETSAQTTVYEPVGGDLANCHVEIVSAERFIDVDGKDAVRFYYDLTNQSWDPISAWDIIDHEADEDGYELVYTWTDENVPEAFNSDLRILPGVTIRCVCEYNYNPNGHVITLTLSDMDGNELSAQFDAQALPGRPGDWQPTPIPGAIYYMDLEDVAFNDGARIHIDDAETDKAAPEYTEGDGRVIRVFFDYTNLMEKVSYLTDTVIVCAFQDGIELRPVDSETYVETDGAFYNEIESGDSIRVSRCWGLRSDSPVVVVAYEWWNNEAICVSTFVL